MKTLQRSLMLSRRDEHILKAVHFYRYMTALDITHLLFSPSAITHVRAVLSELAGGEDQQNGHYLFRFRLPNTTTGNTERVYTLGSRGRDLLANGFGIPVDWYYRPHKMSNMSYSHLTHSLLLTRFLVASEFWCKRQNDFKVIDTRISYQLPSTPDGVIPDAWILFGKEEKKFPVLLEIDRGTEYQQKFKQHIRSRVEFVRSGAYNKRFGIPAVMIAYITTGERPDYRETRQRTMRVWAHEVLQDMQKANWASIFRFSSVSLNDVYKTSGLLFEGPVWYRPDQPEPVALFG